MARSERSEVDPSAVLAALGNTYSADILCATKTPKSAQTLSDDLEVPIATCYRRIEELLEVGLLTCEGRQLSAEGRQTTVYRRTLDRLEVEFADQHPELSETRRTAAQNRLQDQIQN